MPYRAGDLALAGQYEDVLTRSRIRLVEIDRELLRSAARLRAAHRTLRTPDAIQVSAARGARCSAFLTNDRELPAVPGLQILRIRDYVR